MTGLEIFNDVPALTEENYEEVLVVYEKQYRKAYYDDLKDCVEVLKKKYKDIVTGFWYCKEIDVDGGPYFIYRTKEDVTDPNLSGRMHSDIWEFTRHAYLYNMTNDSIQSLYNLPIDKWKNTDFIYAIYDAERRIG